MDVGRTEGVGGPGRIDGPKPVSRINPPAYTGATAPTDKVEISEAAHLISEALALPPVRTERIEEVRKLVESGKFDTDARLGGAIDNFIADNGDLLE